ALRSAATSSSSRRRRRFAWYASPRTSASCFATVAASARIAFLNKPITAPRLAFASDALLRARVRPSGGADRSAPTGAQGPVAAARVRPRDRRRAPPPLLRADGGAPGRARRRERHAGRSRAAPSPARDRGRGGGAARGAGGGRPLGR